ncbi:MAG: hypothetical protein AB7O91_04080 [Sphingomonas sp.]
MLVRAIRLHGNAFGKKHRKEAGDVYEAPDRDAARLIKFGFAEAAEGDELDGIRNAQALKGIARRENIDLRGARTGAAIRAAIRAARAASLT